MTNPRSYHLKVSRLTMALSLRTRTQSQSSRSSPRRYNPGSSASTMKSASARDTRNPSGASLLADLIAHLQGCSPVQCSCCEMTLARWHYGEIGGPGSGICLATGFKRVLQSTSSSRVSCDRLLDGYPCPDKWITRRFSCCSASLLGGTGLFKGCTFWPATRTIRTACAAGTLRRRHVSAL